ncbi:transposase [Rothia uropygialis]|uniref:transposase n=1 Tax=Kocuria sp. 36 TaxID=1415402 RepID=UPI001930FB23
MLLTETIRATGLDQSLSVALALWRRPLAQHDPGKILLDLALTLAMGGIGGHRAEPDVYGPVASDPTISRLLALLASDVDAAERALHTARHRAREAAWARAGKHAPDHRFTGKKVLIRIDGAGATKKTLEELVKRRVLYSVRYTLIDLQDWPEGRRVIVRRERPQPSPPERSPSPSPTTCRSPTVINGRSCPRSAGSPPSSSWTTLASRAPD